MQIVIQRQQIGNNAATFSRHVYISFTRRVSETGAILMAGTAFEPDPSRL